QSPTVPQIAAAMGNTRQGVRKQIKLLAEQGLVQSRPNPTHKRSPLYSLTGNGQTAYEAVVGRWYKHVQAMATQFSAADLDAAIRVLSTMSHVHGPEQ